ncbi:MAG: beta-eliminating lyase-related protein [Nocardioidaceae bacterium]
MADLDDRFRDAVRACDRGVFWRPLAGPAEELRRIADACADLGIDENDGYGERGAVALLEEQVASLLGKPAAVLFISGVMAQQAALRVWCDRSGSRRVALPDLSHLLHHEEDGPRRLHGFEMEWLTTGRQVPTAERLEAVPGRLGAVLVELPLREAGCLLPSWDELVALSAAARTRVVPLHADGARIWESQPFWDRPLPEIAGLVDSIYVSLYKGLAAPSGALVACDEDVAAELQVWRRRMGGTLYRMTTQAVGGLLGLRDELPRMGEYAAWARRLAAALGERGFVCFPDPPHTNTFLVHAAGDPDALNERLLAFTERERLALSGLWHPTDVPGQVVTELAVHARAVEHDPDVVAGWFAEVAGV